MKLAFKIIYAVFCLGIASCTAHFYFCFLFRVRQFVVFDEPLFRPSLSDKVKRYSYVLASWLGTGFLIYAALIMAFDWMPKSWGRVNEDGEYEWFGHSIALVGAFYGALFVIPRLHMIARAVVQLEDKTGRTI